MKGNKGKEKEKSGFVVNFVSMRRSKFYNFFVGSVGDREKKALG